MAKFETKFQRPIGLLAEDVDYAGWELMGWADLAGFEAWLAYLIKESGASLPEDLSVYLVYGSDYLVEDGTFLTE